MHVMAIMAHMDDEVMFCGGLLRLAVERGHDVTIMIATDPSDCNRLDDREANQARIKRRIRGFVNVAQMLRLAGAVAGCGGTVKRYGYMPLPNRIAIGSDLFGELRRRIEAAIVIAEPDLIITHGHDTDHPQHAVVREAVGGMASDQVARTERDGGLRIQYEMAAKREMISCYAEGQHVPNWDPWPEPQWAPWLSGFERFHDSSARAAIMLKEITGQ